MINKNKKAFTLIELLLGLALFAVVASVLYATFSAGLKTNERSEKQSRIVKQAGWTMELMARELEQALPYSFSSLDANLTAIELQNDKVAFIIPGQKGLVRVSYYLESPGKITIHKTIIGQRTKKNVNLTLVNQENEALQILIREEQDFIDYLSGSTEHQTEVLSTRVKQGGLGFDYQMTAEEGKILPASVDISIKFIAEDYPDGILTLRKHVLIPTMVFKFPAGA